MKRQTAQRQRIGPAVRRLRQERGMTLDELAEAASVSPSHLSRLERSQTLPSFPVLAKIAEALDTDVNEFVRLEQDVTQLDHELAQFLELLAIAPEERRELLNLSIEARRSLVERLRALADPALTPDPVQEITVGILRERGGLDGLSATVKLIREAGMSGVAYSRALMRLDQMLGKREVLVAGPSMIPLAPGLDLFEPYREAFGDEALDPAVANWWRRPPDDAVRRGTPQRPVSLIFSRTALDGRFGRRMARCALEVLQRGEHTNVAVTDRDLGPANALVVDGRFGLIEHLPHDGSRQPVRRAAIWLTGPERLSPIAGLFRDLWDQLDSTSKDRDFVVQQLERAAQAAD